ncbi:MAG: hypothetical protein R2831_06095 [Chitinophagaceae bacterium]
MALQTIKKYILFSFIVLSFSSCYYDKAEALKKLDNTVCDTSNVSFSGKIHPIISQNCVNGCHTGASASAGIPLDNYTQIATIANNGKLVGVVSHATGFSPMPKGGAKLGDCSISLIQAWIQQGTKNN